MQILISDATRKNWKRLQTESSERLTSRANKRRSPKKILPAEYFSDKANISFVKNLLERVDATEAEIYSVIFTLSINLLRAQGIYDKAHVQKVLKDFSDAVIIKNFLNIELPANETDILGIIYQAHLREGKKNLRGSYYTPQNIVANMTRHFDFSRGKNFFDPCCGSGSFLIGVNVENPNQLYGVDNDKIAVLISKVNLLLKYPAIEFAPQIYCLDFLTTKNLPFKKKFDFIATNPPWGAIPQKIADDNAFKETFAAFFVKAARQLKSNGTIRFLFPEAVLNVLAHKNLREFILDAGLVSITKYAENFSGVMTKYVDVECGSHSDKNSFQVFSGNLERRIDIKTICETQNLNFNFLSAADVTIIHAVKAKGRYTLADSIWALGIVTGDNKNKLFPTPQLGTEKIYTGKEIQPFALKPAKHWLTYDRNNFQQVAKDEIYRAAEKLVYKFISDKLVFAYDDTQSLFLNSANILVPAVPNMNIKIVMAFLNSALFNFVYAKLFGGIKILKSNLIELPFPKISSEENFYLTNLVDAILSGADKRAELEEFIFSFYGISTAQAEHIWRFVNGKVD